MKSALPALLVAALGALTGPVTAQARTQTLHYPTEDESMFTIKAPGDWEVTGIDEVGEFGSLESENGSILQFRALVCENEKEAIAEIESIAEATLEALEENFTDVELGEVEESEVRGAAVFEVSGTAKDKEGNDLSVLTSTIVLGETTIAEIWAAVYPEDVAAAKATLSSFRPTATVAAE